MKTLYRLGGAALVALGSISAAHAALEEIIVTAQLRDTSLQTTPIAVTAMTTADLARLNVDMGLDLGAAVPNMQTYQVTSNASAMQVFMRGAGIQNPGFVASESPVGIYVDGVIRSRLATANLDLTDLERIEVLRGPQGTLYGRNSIAGAVKIITRTPGEDSWANAAVGYGNYETTKLNASVGGEIAPGIGGSVTGLLHKRDEGWITRGSIGGRDLGEYDNKAIRGKLNWFGGDMFAATLAAGYVKDKNDGYNGIPYGPSYNPASSPGQPLQGFYDTLIPDSSIGTGLAEEYNVSLDMSWQLGSAMELHSITGYVHGEDTFAFDLNGGAAQFPPGPVLIGVPGVLIASTSTNKTFSQELTLGGQAADDRLEWITGLYYMNEEGDQNYNPSAGPSNITESINTTTNSYAIFAEGTWSFTDKLSATLGGRYTRDEKEYQNNCIATAGSSFPACYAADGSSITMWTSNLDKDFSEFTPRLMVQYDFTDDVMLYGSLSSGFQAGGFQTLCFGFQSCTDQIYDPQKVKSAEIGNKLDLLDNTLRINTAVFYAEYDDMQQTSIEGALPVFPVLNVGKSNVAGLELEINWSPIDSVNAYLIGALAKDHITSAAVANLPPSATNMGERRLPGLPEETLRIGGDWHPKITAEWAFLVGADVNYVGDYYATINNNVLLDSYTRLSGRIGFDQPDGHWSLMLTGQNLTDEETNISAISGNGTNIRTPLPPTEWMFTVAYQY